MYTLFYKQIMSFHQEDEELSQSMARFLIEDDTSFYIPEDTSRQILGTNGE